jgi:hypothetical protein
MVNSRPVADGASQGHERRNKASPQCLPAIGDRLTLNGSIQVDQARVKDHT